MAIMRRITEINGEIIMVENYDYCRQYYLLDREDR